LRKRWMSGGRGMESDDIRLYRVVVERRKTILRL
jgi:hypothetical protein